MSDQPAVHPSGAFDDTEAVSLVARLIAKSRLAMPDIKANDKWPNLDGFVELVDEMGAPIGKVHVQIKKLSTKAAASRSFAFENDKFLNYCRSAVDETIVLIGVDLASETVYWIHVDAAYVAALNGSRTVKFNDQNRITATSLEYVEKWRSLVKARREKVAEYDQMKKVYEEIVRLGSPAFGKRDARFARIHEFLDAYNSLLDGEYAVVKRRYYAGAWKVGLAFHHFEEERLSYGLYPIASDTNDVQIREIAENPMATFRKRGLPMEGWTQMSSNPILSEPNALSRKLVLTKLRKVMEHRGLDHGVNDLLAAEYIFAYVDKHRLSLGLPASDEYEIEALEIAFNRFLPVWVDEGVRNIQRRRGPGMKLEWILGHDGLGRQPWINLASMRSFLSDEHCVAIEAAVRERIERGETATPDYPIHDDKLPPNVFVDFLSYCRRRGIERVRRPFPRHVHEGGSGGIWAVWTPEELRSALSLAYREFARVLVALCERNFPQLTARLIEPSPHVVVLALLGDMSRERVGSGENNAGPSVIEVMLEDPDSPRPDVPQVIILEGDEAEKVRECWWKHDEPIVISETRYRTGASRWTTLDHVYSSTPLMHMVYHRLAERITAIEGHDSPLRTFRLRL